MVWPDILHQVVAKDLVAAKQRSTIVLPSTATMAQALETLRANDILSAPVAKDNRFCGFFDVADIACWSLDVKNLDDAGSPQLANPFFQRAVSGAINFSGSDEALAVSEHTTLFDLLKLFSRPRKGVWPHRVAVVGEQGSICNVLSQSDIVKWAADNLSHIPAECVSASLERLGLASRGVITALLSETVVGALQLLVDNRIGGIALVDESFRVCGNFSASDLRGLMPESFDYFHGSVLQFLAKASRPYAPLTLSPSGTVGDVITLLATSRKHRVFVCDGDLKPLGVVTLSDVAEMLLAAASAAIAAAAAPVV